MRTQSLPQNILPSCTHLLHLLAMMGDDRGPCEEMEGGRYAGQRDDSSWGGGTELDSTGPGESSSAYTQKGMQFQSYELFTF